MSKVDFDFSAECYVVTGASSGMGREVAVELAASGAKVLAIARNTERLENLKAEYPKNIITAALDVTDSNKLEQAIADFVLVNGKLSGAVHAAGINSFTPLKSYDKDLAKRIMITSFWAGIELTRLVTKAKYGMRGTSTVLFSSVCAYSSEKGMFAYAAAKAAVNGALGSIAKEIAMKEHRINSIMPGWVESSAMTYNIGGLIDQEDFKKKHLLGLAKPSDVAGMVLFLLSNRARWITGTSVVVDGGFLA